MGILKQFSSIERMTDVVVARGTTILLQLMSID
jgi:hypothetical protein